MARSTHHGAAPHGPRRTLALACVTAGSMATILGGLMALLSFIPVGGA